MVTVDIYCIQQVSSWYATLSSQSSFTAMLLGFKSYKVIIIIIPIRNVIIINNNDLRLNLRSQMQQKNVK